MLSDRNLSQKTTNYRIHLYEMCKIVKDSSRKEITGCSGLESRKG